MNTSNVDAVKDCQVGNHARPVSHDVVCIFMFSVSTRASAGLNGKHQSNLRPMDRLANDMKKCQTGTCLVTYF